MTDVYEVNWDMTHYRYSKKEGWVRTGDNHGQSFVAVRDGESVLTVLARRGIGAKNNGDEATDVSFRSRKMVVS